MAHPRATIRFLAAATSFLCVMAILVLWQPRGLCTIGLECGPEHSRSREHCSHGLLGYRSTTKTRLSGHPEHVTTGWHGWRLAATLAATGLAVAVMGFAWTRW